jgi:hypothetical protein
MGKSYLPAYFVSKITRWILIKFDMVGGYTKNSREILISVPVGAI